MILYDKNGNPVEVPDNQVAQALATGQLGLPRDARPTFIKPTGEVVSLDADPAKIIQAIGAGYQIETPEQARERMLQVEYGGTGGQMAAAALGAARALSFGASDWVAKALGAEETVKGLKAANPEASIGGEWAGLGAALLTPGGAAKAGKLFSKIGAPVRGVAKLGKKTEQMALRALGGAKGGTVRQALAKGASLGVGSGVEGAIYGAGQWASDAALGDAELTAESLMGYAQTGALWGAGIGGALGSGSEILRRGIGSGRAFATKGAKSIRKMWETARGRKALPGVDAALEEILEKPGVWDEAMGRMIGEDPAALTSLRKSPEKLKKATQSLKIRDDAAREVSSLRNIARKAEDDVISVSRGRMKKDVMAEIASQGDEMAAAIKAQNLIDDLRVDLDDMLSRPGEYGFTATTRKMNKILDATEERMRKTLFSKEPGAGGRLFNELDQFKRDLGNLRSKMNRVRDPGSLEYAAMDRFSDMYMKIREPLESEALWGARAAQMQRAVNEKWTAFLRKSKFKKRYRLDRMAGEVDWGKQSADEGAKLWEADPGEMRKFIDDMGSPRADLDLEHFRGQAQLKDELMDEISRHYDLGERAESLTVAKDANAKIKRIVDEMEETVGLQNQLSDIVQASSAMSAVVPAGIGGIGGFMVGGPLGAMAGVLLSPLSNPGRLLHLKAAFHRMKEGFQLELAKSLSGYIKTAKSAAKGGVGFARKAYVPASMSVLENSFWGDKKDRSKDRYEAFNKRYRELSEFMSNPSKAIEKMGKNLDGIHEAAPEVAEQMAVKAMQAANFLMEKSPKPLSRDFLMEEDWRPSDVDLAKWERYVAAVQDPTELLKELQAGMLSVETVEAVRAIYPRLYEQIVTHLAEEIPMLREKLPYDDRVQLSILFNLPVEESMNNDFVATMQSIAQMETAQQMPQMPTRPAPRSRSRAGAFSKIESGDNLRTASQGVAARAAKA
jgi:hypothetical protein